MKELTKSQEKKLLGVAGGMAEYFEMDRSIIRALWIFGCILVPPGIIAYFILALVLPQPNTTQRPTSGQPSEAQPFGGASAQQPINDTSNRIEADSEPAQGTGGFQSTDGSQTEQRTSDGPERKLTKSRDRWISGVAGGVAEYFGLDPALLRVLFAASIFLGGSGILVYIIMAIVMPRPEPFNR